MSNLLSIQFFHRRRLPACLFLSFVSATLLFFQAAQAQGKKSGGSCLSSEFKAIAYATNDAESREKNALDWLARVNKSDCSMSEVSAIYNNASLWLGTSNTPRVYQAISALAKNSKSLDTETVSRSNPSTQSTTPPSGDISTTQRAKRSVAKKADDPVAISPTSSLRESEINQCLPNEIATWNDGAKDSKMINPQMTYVYDHQGAPEGISEESVVVLLQKSSTSWDQCGGQNTVVLKRDVAPATAGLKIATQWNDEDKLGTIGLANITKKTLTLSPEAFLNLRKKNANRNLLETLQMVVSHEIGHFQGLTAHSKRCVDVLSYYTSGTGEKCFIRNNGVLPTDIEYRSQLPTACDIKRCRVANGQKD